ncbi:MAG: DUF1549 domain-containing protein [Isosphaeraceae bacterium]
MIVSPSWIRCGLRAFLGLAIGLLGVTRAGAASTDSPEAQSIQHFEAKVRLVLVASCVRCHGPEKQRGGLRVDTREALLRGGESGPALVPGQAEESLLYQKLVDGEMPPRTEPRLDVAQVADIRQWIRSGAHVTALKAEIGRANAEDWWAFRRPDRGRAVAALPPSLKERLGVETRWKLAGGGFEVVDEHRSGSSRIHPIDAFVGDELAKQGLESAPRADRRTLVRRASFDLLGLPPTPEQVEAFVNDPAPRAWERLLASLLASPHYGERWGRHWLDVARYADSGGYETDMYYRLAWRYRDYVVRSFNEDRPYSRFVQEQIAGDELWPDDLELHGTYALAESKRRALEAHVGTGFYALGPQIHESSMDARKADQERLTDWVDATGSAFLGITLGCARCHDHKFDPFTQQDYYGLQAIFARSREGERAIINGMEHADFKQHYPRILAVAAARDAYRRHEQALAGRPPSPAEAAQRDELLRAIGRAVLKVPERATSTPNTPFDGLLELKRVGQAVLEHERPELVKPVHLPCARRPQHALTGGQAAPCRSGGVDAGAARRERRPHQSKGPGSG